MTDMESDKVERDITQTTIHVLSTPSLTGEYRILEWFLECIIENVRVGLTEFRLVLIRYVTRQHS